MTLFIVVGLLMVLAFGILFYVAYGSTGGAIKQFEANVQHAANNTLEEMFIFVDEKNIKRISVILLLLVALIAYVLWQSALIAVISAAMVFFAPNAAIALIKKKRNDQFNKDLPDALLSMANMLRSGLNLPGALAMVVAETKGPISQEFGLLLNELKLGSDFATALDGMYRRVPIADLELVIAGMKISREVGGSLAEVLARLSETIRKRIEMEGKIKSLTSMGMLQGWVMTLLPIGVGYAIYLIEPKTMRLLFTDWRGWLACTVIITLLFFGYKFIKLIVTIDV